ncbi:hypothetical protein Hdeb2414_s0615g00924661 [Helianthus debilis subsp. tardiflorus]
MVVGMKQLYYKMLREQAHGWLKWCQVCHSFISHSSLHKERSYDSHTFDGDGIDNDVSCLLTMGTYSPKLDRNDEKG